jgi:hypothetical protein
MIELSDVTKGIEDERVMPTAVASAILPVLTRAKTARQQQTVREIEALLKAVKEWKETREDDDRDAQNNPRGQYHTQLGVIVGEVTGAATALLKVVDGIDLGGEIGAVYGACSSVDAAVAWLWRVFEFFRVKFDQRDVPALRSTLQAADEIVWSCYRPFFASPAAIKEPAPLPCIVEEYSASVLLQKRVPAGLEKGKEKEALRDYIEKLPVPILYLPRSAVQAPWHLILIGHEVGHIVQAMVAPEFVVRFRKFIEVTILAENQPVATSEAWGAWAPEIFADWYSVQTVGPWAAWMTIQLELTDAASLLAPRSRYPAPLTRQALLAEFATRAGAAGRPVDFLRRFGVESEGADFSLPAAVARAMAAMPELEQVRSRVESRAMDFQPGGDVERWSRVLAEGKSPNTGRQLRTPRLLAAACGQARWESQVEKEANSPDGGDELEIVRTVIRGAGVEGRRGLSGVAESTPAAEKFAELLLRAGKAEGEVI